MQYLSSRQMLKVDKHAEEYGISVLQMMELAGFHTARFCASLKPGKVVVLYGKGNNGADGLAAARHLAIMGAEVEVIGAEEPGEHAARHLKAVRRMGIKELERVEASDADIVVDALLGCSIKGNPRHEYARLISEANHARHKGAEIVSIDLPSGLDPDTGASFSPVVDADFVITLGMPKKGLKDLKCRKYLANIGIPHKAYSDVGIEIDNLFEHEDLVKL